mmetsp:Transcript_76193/g.176768  ORF Transcript_76193/g.176768 Transcript_76193/m.176768 type:complete len:366 (-) Transcript_76193:91-1188(-)
MATPPLHFALLVLWALLVGASVTANLVVGVVLNKRAPQASRDAHSVYITNLSVLLGALLLLPRCFTARAPCSRPKRWWSLAGGICTLPTFLCLPAGALLGSQVVLLTQLVAMLGTALIFDVHKGRVQLTDVSRLGGFAVVLTGVVVEVVGARGAGRSGLTVVAALFLLGVFASGVGYALQAKSNSRLAKDVGSTARSTAISSAVTLVACLPLDIVLSALYGVTPVVSLKDRWLWLFVGAQSAFYIASLSRLPGYLGYTTSYLMLLLGKLASSSVADAVGLTGTKVPFDWIRALALFLVFFGTGLFSRQGHEAPPRQVSSFHPAFVDPSVCETDGDEVSLQGNVAGAGNDLDDQASLQGSVAARPQ